MADEMSGEGSPGMSLPEDDLETRRITWPTVLGATCIVYAVLGVFANGCGLGNVFLGDIGFKMAGIEVEGGLNLPAWITVSTVILGALGLILAGLLFVGAGGLIRRQPGSVSLLKLWAVAAILASVVQIVLGFLSIDNNVDLQLRVQDAQSEMLRSQDPEISQKELAILGLTKSAGEIRTQSIQYTVILGGMPMIYPILLGFFLTRKGRIQQAEAWN